MYGYRKLKDIPQELRPREKLKKLGAQSLSDEELLAVILGSGTKGKDVLSLSRALIRMGWKELERMNLSELTKIKGLGSAKAMQLIALLELSRRIREPYGREQILSPEEAYKLLRRFFSKDRESLVAVYLDLSHRVMHVETLAVGSMNRVFISPREVLKPAVELSSYGILIAHNHPQGTPHPSESDIDFTRRLKEACELLGFELVDHIILSEEGYVSLKEERLLD